MEIWVKKEWKGIIVKKREEKGKKEENWKGKDDRKEREKGEECDREIE